MPPKKECLDSKSQRAEPAHDTRSQKRSSASRATTVPKMVLIAGVPIKLDTESLVAKYNEYQELKVELRNLHASDDVELKAHMAKLVIKAWYTANELMRLLEYGPSAETGLGGQLLGEILELGEEDDHDG